METLEKEKVVYGTFLQNRIVAVKPIESSGKWSSLLVQGQERKKDPFLYNKVKRSYDVPLQPEHKGGGITVILDDQKRVLIQKYMESFPHGMTQKEFFEKELGANLNPSLQEKNFWRDDRRARVMITKEGITLNLNQPLDMLKYLILLANERTISPSYEGRHNKASYEFMMVDESKVTAKLLEEGQETANAYIKYAEVTQSKASTVGFIKALGRAIPKSATSEWLKGEVLKIVQTNPKYFLEIVNHPQYNERIFVQEAIEAGAILKKGEKRYTLDNGVELGDLTDTVNFLLNGDNQDVKLRIKAKIELANK
jgi:hypothetical protein